MSAVFPVSVATTAGLRGNLVNNLATLLDGALLVGATTIPVDDTTSFPSAGYATIHKSDFSGTYEIFQYTGKTATTFTGVTRGVGGSTAAAWNDDDSVSQFWVADHHNHHVEETIAAQQNISDRFGLDSGSHVAKFVDGAVGAPSISFAADTNTGIYRIGADNLGFATGGTLAMQISSAQKVGIGGAPGTYFLKVVGGNTNSMAIDNDGTQYTELDFLHGGVAKFVMYWDDTNTNFQFGTGTGTTTMANSMNMGSGKVLFLADGSAGSPSLSFNSDTNTGIYWISADKIGISTGGVVKITVDSGGTTTFVESIREKDGGVGAPSYTFANDTDTGIYSGGANLMAFTTGGVLALYIDGSGCLQFVDGTVGAPAIRFINDPDTGIYRPTSNQLNITVGGVELANFHAAGTSDATAYALAYFNSGGGSAETALQILTQSTTGVTTAATILSLDLEGGLAMVYGTDGTNDFCDIIHLSYYATGGSPGVISSRVTKGTPAARTYSCIANGSTRVAMASGTYTIRATSLMLNHR